MTAATPTLDIKNATVFRGNTCVFERLNLHLPGKRNCAIIGPNGAGKSSLLKMLLRELHPVVAPDCHVQVLGRERWNVMQLRQQLGVVSNDLQIRYSPDASGLSVMLSGYYSSIGTWGHQSFDVTQKNEAESLMDELGVLHLKDKPFIRMSTGEQRRLLLGRALINNPDMLILDEPTSGLDVPAMFDYLKVISRLMADGHTVVLVTHHLHEIPPEVDYVVLLSKGSVLAAGEKTDVLSSENLSTLFRTDLELVCRRGWFQVLPA